MLRVKRRSFAALLVFTYLLFAVTASASVRHVWAVNDGEKVERDDLNNPNKSTNSAWDGHKIKIFGARNEIIAFQLIVEAGQDGINHLTVARRALTDHTDADGVPQTICNRARPGKTARDQECCRGSNRDHLSGVHNAPTCGRAPFH
jgi:hypothetical protein